MNAFNITDETIHAWLIRHIRKQRMIESLDWIASQIKADTDDGYAYTKATEMNEVRKVWWEQMQFAKSEQ